MRWKKTISMIEAHVEGEVGRVVTGGVVDLPGKTMLDKMNYLNQVDDSLRRFLVFEPRGSWLGCRVPAAEGRWHPRHVQPGGS